MYGKGLRLPDKGAVIGLLKEIRRLVFPAYYGDPELMTLPVEDYTALLLERIEGPAGPADRFGPAGGAGAAGVGAGP